MSPRYSNDRRIHGTQGIHRSCAEMIMPELRSARPVICPLSQGAAHPRKPDCGRYGPGVRRTSTMPNRRPAMNGRGSVREASFMRLRRSPHSGDGCNDRERPRPIVRAPRSRGNQTEPGPFMTGQTESEDELVGERTRPSNGRPVNDQPILQTPLSSDVGRAPIPSSIATVVSTGCARSTSASRPPCRISE